MNAQYEVSQFSLQSLATSLSCIQIKVHGFWSRDSITIYVNRGFSEKSKWNISISWSSGSRDTKEVEKDEDAAENFAAAMLKAAEIARNLRINEVFLEDFYQKHAAELRAEYEKQQQEKQRLVDEDTIMTEEYSKELIAKNVPSGPVQVVISLRERGKTTFANYGFRRTHEGGRLVVEVNGRVSSMKKAIDHMVQQSATYSVTI